MITKNELVEYAKLKNLNLGQAELDYVQNLILFLLSKKGKDIIFKGGTALYKAYNLDRFSEDLDFTITSGFNPEEEIKEAVRLLERYGVYGRIAEKKEYKDSLSMVTKFEGPLYSNSITTTCKVRLDFSLREKIVLAPDFLKIHHNLAEIPLFSFFVMNLEEVLAEKIRAVMTRKKARDVYDLDYLFKKGVKFRKDIAEEKLKFYGLRWQSMEFMHKVKEKKEIWESELKHLIDAVPDFNDSFSHIRSNIP